MQEMPTAMMSQTVQTRLPYLARFEHLENARFAVATVASGDLMALVSLVETAGTGHIRRRTGPGGASKGILSGSPGR